LFSFTASLLSPRRLLPLGLLGALMIVLLTAASARATALIDTDPCDNATLTQPFAPWGDSFEYKLAPGADFEGSLSGWTLTRGATRVAGSEPFGATGTVGSYSMYLPAGASVQTPFTCVDAEYPTFRFFGRNNGLLSIVAVSIVYKEPLGLSLTLPVGTFMLNGSWAPSEPMATAAALQGAVSAVLTGQTPQVALRFTAVTGSSQLDDIYIDPHAIW
jgi:hypothetical protein